MKAWRGMRESRRNFWRWLLMCSDVSSRSSPDSAHCAWILWPRARGRQGRCVSTLLVFSLSLSLSRNYRNLVIAQHLDRTLMETYRFKIFFGFASLVPASKIAATKRRCVVSFHSCSFLSFARPFSACSARSFCRPLVSPRFFSEERGGGEGGGAILPRAPAPLPSRDRSTLCALPS